MMTKGRELQIGDDMDGTMVVRKARKAHACDTYRPLIDHDTGERGDPVRGWDHGVLPKDHIGIKPGDLYIEYLGDASPYRSGARYCAPCAIACGLAWRAD